MSKLTAEDLAVLNYDWGWWARPSQMVPPGDWDIWLIMSGRGFGKTRTGAETVRSWVDQGFSRILLVADDAKDARDIMIEGESGLLSIYPKSDRPRYIASQAKVEWPNGATAILYSASDPESLRGPQGEKAWCDELAKWRYQRMAWDMLMFGMRLGAHPQTVVTTTPTPTPVIKELVATARVADYIRVTGGSTHENLDNLAPMFRRQILKYEGTRLGRQELYAELLDDVPGALWSLTMIDQCHVDPTTLPHFERVVVSVDPAVSVSKNSNETGILVIGAYRDRNSGDLIGIVLEDLSGLYSPLGWASEAVAAYRRWHADRIVAEVNQGGDLVESNIRQVDRAVPYTAVHARKGKYLRAEPVAALYEKNRVFHAGLFPELESQMTEWVAGEDSPDRLDALVHGLTNLIIDTPPPPQPTIAAAMASTYRHPGGILSAPGSPFAAKTARDAASDMTMPKVHPGRL